MGCQEIEKGRKDERLRPKKRKLHELPHKEIVKSGTIRLASDYSESDYTKDYFGEKK